MSLLLHRNECVPSWLIVQFGSYRLWTQQQKWGIWQVSIEKVHWNWPCNAHSSMPDIFNLATNHVDFELLPCLQIHELLLNFSCMVSYMEIIYLVVNLCLFHYSIRKRLSLANFQAKFTYFLLYWRQCSTHQLPKSCQFSSQQSFTFSSHVARLSPKLHIEDTSWPSQSCCIQISLTGHDSLLLISFPTWKR